MAGLRVGDPFDEVLGAWLATIRFSRWFSFSRSFKRLASLAFAQEPDDLLGGVSATLHGLESSILPMLGIGLA